MIHNKGQSTSLLFSDPIQILTTNRLADIPALIQEVNRAVTQNLYAAGYLTFEAGYAFIDRLAALSPETYSFPLAWFGLYRTPMTIDLSIIALSHSLSSGPDSPATSVIRPEDYLQTIMAIKNLIARGEIYQMNYTWQAQLPPIPDPLGLFCHLRQNHPVPYSAFLATDELIALSLSPELFFFIHDNKITTRPMKGTMPRGSNADDDFIRRQALETSEKDRAENLMIVDLLRNDLNRICETGSVRAPRLFTIEEYPSLFQMTSTVTGKLRSGITFNDILSSLFPCGSVTGAPKVRAMELIRNLENGPRGIYTGSIGYLSPSGEAFFNVAIRTITIDHRGPRLGLGSGIVWDSDPQSEYEECLLKMKFITGGDDFALIETLLCDRGNMPLLHSHCARMAASARHFNIPVDEGPITAALSDYCASLDRDAVYRIKITCDSRGALSIEHESVDLSPRPDACRGALAQMHVNSTDPLLGHKTTRRKFRDNLLGLARSRGLDEVIFLNERGEVTEGCISNVFIKKDGKMLTPSLSCGVLPGVMRRHILDSDPAAQETTLTCRDLDEADEIFICNALRGMRTVIVDTDLML